MATKKIIINSEKKAFEVIEQALTEGFGNQITKLEFKGWPILEIELKGPGYHSTITPDMAAALVDLQRAMNRSYARVVHGRTTSRILTDDEKEQLQFKAKVEDGSSLITVDLGDYAGKLAESVVSNMTPELLTVSILGVTLIAGGVVALKGYLKSQTDGKEIEAKNALALSMTQEETKRQEILARAMKEVASLAIAKVEFDHAKDSILKGVSDAESLGVNGVTIDRETARLAVKKKREESIDVQLNGTYYVTETNLKKDEEVRLGLRRAQDNREFTASFMDHSLDQKQIALLQEAEWGRKPVFLSINATELRGEITSARVVSVSPQPDLP